MKKLIFGLLCFNLNYLWADAISTGTIKFVLPSTNTVDPVKSWAIKYNDNWQKADSAFNAIFTAPFLIGAQNNGSPAGNISVLNLSGTGLTSFSCSGTTCTAVFSGGAGGGGGSGALFLVPGGLSISSITFSSADFKTISDGLKQSTITFNRGSTMTVTGSWAFGSTTTFNNKVFISSNLVIGSTANYNIPLIVSRAIRGGDGGASIPSSLSGIALLVEGSTDPTTGGNGRIIIKNPVDDSEVQIYANASASVIGTRNSFPFAIGVGDQNIIFIDTGIVGGGGPFINVAAQDLKFGLSTNLLDIRPSSMFEVKDGSISVVGNGGGIYVAKVGSVSANALESRGSTIAVQTYNLVFASIPAAGQHLFVAQLNGINAIIAGGGDNVGAGGAGGSGALFLVPGGISISSITFSSSDFKVISDGLKQSTIAFNRDSTMTITGAWTFAGTSTTFTQSSMSIAGVNYIWQSTPTLGDPNGDDILHRVRGSSYTYWGGDNSGAGGGSGNFSTLTSPATGPYNLAGVGAVIGSTGVYVSTGFIAIGTDTAKAPLTIDMWNYGSPAAGSHPAFNISSGAVIKWFEVNVDSVVARSSMTASIFISTPIGNGGFIGSASSVSWLNIGGAAQKFQVTPNGITNHLMAVGAQAQFDNGSPTAPGITFPTIIQGGLFTTGSNFDLAIGNNGLARVRVNSNGSVELGNSKDKALIAAGVVVSSVLVNSPLFNVSSDTIKFEVSGVSSTFNTDLISNSSFTVRDATQTWNGVSYRWPAVPPTDGQVPTYAAANGFVNWQTPSASGGGSGSGALYVVPQGISISSVTFDTGSFNIASDGLKQSTISLHRPLNLQDISGNRFGISAATGIEVGVGLQLTTYMSTTTTILNALSNSTTTLGISSTIIFNQESPDISNRTYYVTDVTTGMASLWRLLGSSPAATSEVSRTVSISAAQGIVSVSSNITAAGDPGIRKLPAGVWSFTTWVQAASILNSVNLVITVSTVSFDNTQITEVLSSTSSNFLTTDVQRFDMVAIQTQDIVLSTSDRILVRYWGQTSNAVAVNFTMYYAGTTRFSHLTTPIGAVYKFTQLADAPQSLIGQAGKYLSVNADQTATVFVTTITDNLNNYIVTNASNTNMYSTTMPWSATQNFSSITATNVGVTSITFPASNPNPALFPNEPQIGPAAWELLTSSVIDNAISTMTVVFSSRTNIWLVFITSPADANGGDILFTFNNDVSTSYQSSGQTPLGGGISSNTAVGFLIGKTYSANFTTFTAKLVDMHIVLGNYFLGDRSIINYQYYGGGDVSGNQTSASGGGSYQPQTGISPTITTISVQLAPVVGSILSNKQSPQSGGCYLRKGSSIRVYGQGRY